MSDLQTINLLSINVIKTHIDSINNVSIVDEIVSENTLISERYLEDKHHTYYEDKRYPFNRSESEKLIKVLTAKVSEIVGMDMVMDEIWTLTLLDGQSVAAHSHKSNRHMNDAEYYSIAYYPDAPEGSADLIFLVDACNTIERSVSITPQTGDLIIFNSYLMHMTNRHQNKNKNRIVISANFSPKNPDTRPTQDWSAYSRIEETTTDSRLNESSWGCVATVLTPFGEENYLISVSKNKDFVQISGEKGQVKTETFSLSETVFECRFTTNTPIDAECVIVIDIDSSSNNIYGSLRINEYPGYPLVGKIK
jgi:hypothetical protein